MGYVECYKYVSYYIDILFLCSQQAQGTMSHYIMKIQYANQLRCIYLHLTISFHVCFSEPILHETSV